MKILILIACLIITLLIIYTIVNKKKHKEGTYINSLKSEDNKYPADLIISRLRNIRKEYLNKMTNYEITFLTQTKLQDYNLANKIYERFPKTLDREIMDISNLYDEFDYESVNANIIQYIDELGGKDFELEQNLPPVRLEYFVRNEAKKNANKFFEKYLTQNT